MPAESPSVMNMPADRELTLEGVTLKVNVETETRPIYVTVNFQDGRPFEVFVRIDDAALFEWAAAFTVMLTRLLRAGEPLGKIAAELKEIHSPRTSHFHKGVQVPSLLARIGDTLLQAIEEYSDGSN